MGSGRTQPYVQQILAICLHQRWRPSFMEVVTLLHLLTRFKIQWNFISVPRFIALCKYRNRIWWLLSSLVIRDEDIYSQQRPLKTGRIAREEGLLNFNDVSVSGEIILIGTLCGRVVVLGRGHTVLTSRELMWWYVCSWDVRGNLTLNSMAQIHTSITLLTSRDLTWSSGRLTRQHASHISVGRTLATPRLKVFTILEPVHIFTYVLLVM